MINDSRPRPIRTAALVVSAVGAVVTWLVSSGILDVGQGDAVQGLIAAVVLVLSAFGVPLLAEPKVTPLSDPMDSRGRLLAPVRESDL